VKVGDYKKHTAGEKAKKLKEVFLAIAGEYPEVKDILWGVEVYSSKHSLEEMKAFRRFAEELKNNYGKPYFIMTIGSDAHYNSDKAEKAEEMGNGRHGNLRVIQSEQAAVALETMMAIAVQNYSSDKDGGNGISEDRKINAEKDGGEETLITVLPEGLIPDRGVAYLKGVTVTPPITSYGNFYRIGGRVVDVLRQKDSLIVIKRFNSYLSDIQWPVEVLNLEAIVKTSHYEDVIIDGWPLIKIPQVSAFRYLPGMLIQQLTVKSHCRMKYRELAKALNRQEIRTVDGFNTVSNIGNINNKQGGWEVVLVDNNSIKPRPSRIKRFLETLPEIAPLGITNQEILDFVRKSRQKHGPQLIRGFSAEDVVLAAGYHRARAEDQTVMASLVEALRIWKSIYDKYPDGYTDSSFIKQLDGGRPVLSVVTEVPARLQMHTPLPPIKRDRKFKVYADWVMLYGLSELILYAFKWSQNVGLAMRLL